MTDFRAENSCLACVSHPYLYNLLTVAIIWFDYLFSVFWIIIWLSIAGVQLHLCSRLFIALILCTFSQFQPWLSISENFYVKQLFGTNVPGDPTTAPLLIIFNCLTTVMAYVPDVRYNLRL